MLKEKPVDQGDSAVAYVKNKHCRLTFFSLALMAIHTSSSYAAPLNNLPSSATPESSAQAISGNVPPPVEGPQLLPPLEQGKEVSKTPLGKEAEKITFVLKKVKLEGNTVYSTKTLSTLYQSKLNKKISIADLYLLAQSITNYYRNNGYILSRAILPPQHIRNGEVTIRIIEGYVDKVTVGGNPDGAKCIVQAYSNHIKDSRPLQLYDLEYYTMLANEIPGCAAKAVLTPSKSSVGAADVAMMTNTERFRGYISYDDYGTRYIGPQQITANIDYSSIIASGDNIDFTFAETLRDKELNYTDINYLLPITSYGLKLNFGKTRTKTHPMFVLEPADVLGINDIYYTTLSIPVVRSRTKSYTITIGINVTDVDVTVTPEVVKLYIDHIRSLYLSNVYGFTDTWYGNNLISFDVRKGLPAFGYTRDTSITAATSRPQGHADYTKISTQATRLQAITNTLSAYGLIRGQYSFNPLLASEEFVFGGNVLGRAYDPSEIIGDHGVAGTLELRYDWAATMRFLQSIQFYVYYDFGKIWNIVKTINGIKKDSATSTGVGSRFSINQHLSGNIMWTKPLTREVNAEALVGKGFAPRVFFSIQANWS